jgi:hypothetical protein
VQKRLNTLKLKSKDLAREDFVWHYLLQSYSTLGRSGGFESFNQINGFTRLSYTQLEKTHENLRLCYIQNITNEARLRFPNNKALQINSSFNIIRTKGGLSQVRTELLNTITPQDKITYLMEFPGIGPKYSRNIMMDVYHPQFRDSIAVDSRINRLLNNWNVNLNTYEEKENYLLGLAQASGIEGWELDRMLYNFKDRFIFNY